jgi:hypothetical protein
LGYCNIALKGAEIFNKGLQSWCKSAGKGFSVETFQPILKSTELKWLKYAPKLEGDVLQLSKKSAKQIFEEFKPVTTIEEASKRAIDEYGLKAFDIKDIDVANDALFVLHKIKCKSTTPLGITEIIEVPIIGNNSNIVGRIYTETGKMEISRNAIKNNALERISVMTQQLPSSKFKEYRELLIKMDEGEIPMFKLTQDMERLGLKASTIEELPFQTIIHEQGHRVHFLSVPNEELYWKMGKLEEIKEAGITDFSIFEEFMSDKVQNIIKSWHFLGDYARTSPCEFVAEVYSALIHDVKVPENIMKLYEKYHGPKAI